MLGRKRRASSISSKQDEDPLQIDDSTPEQSPTVIAPSTTATSTTRKKRRPDPSELCQQIYDSIRNLKKEDGTTLCDTFVRAPKRRQEPSYYDVVANPIDLLKIQQKLKMDSYDDVEDLMHDFELLVKNAKAFYKPDTSEHQDAVTLWQHIQTNKNRILEAHGVAIDEEPKAKRVSRTARRLTGNEIDTGAESGRSLDDEFNPYEELFASVMTAVDPGMNDRPLHRMFQLLPSKKIYPDYYDVIEHPIDLRLIATKIQMNAYSHLVEMERDLLQMTKNACQFNEPGSQIYKDAKTLKRIFTLKRADLDAGKCVRTGRRSRTLSSAAIAALKEEVDSSDDEETSKKGEGPMWALFDYLYNAAGAADHPGATGLPLGTSLWKLPVRRFHPDYFELIKRPISMCQIHTKLKKGDYANISDLTGDLYLMLDNAKKAFGPSHRTHKDAVKMLKIMNAKLVEESLDQETSEMEEDEADEAAASSVPALPKKKGRPRINSNSSAPATPTTTNSSPKTSRILLNAAMKKKILSIQKYLVDYTEDGRQPIELFMDRPPRKIYPDYYDIIANPIDMNTIEHNIKTDKYTTLEDVVADYRLMFTNCRHYNEEGSTIYEDANNLERALNEKLKEFPNLLEDMKRPAPAQKMPKPGRKRAAASAAESKLWQFYDTIKEYQEPKARRQLSLIFTKLPSKVEYPDYYDIIREPIDMERIAQKLKQSCYESVDDLAADFLLMLENACKYNEPDSQIYKDALVLQQLTVQTQQSLRSEREAVPDVAMAVQELFLTLFTSMYNHQDEEGRCYTDSLAELPEYDEISTTDEKSGLVTTVTTKLRGISLDLIKRRLDKGVYKRLDTFQEDMFTCLERARKLSRTDSDVFQDSIELQSHFLRRRDELCKDTLTSPALQAYTLEKLLAEVEAMRQQKISQEEQDQENDKEEPADTVPAMEGGSAESVTINQHVYSPGEFVYCQLPENKVPSIAYIERLWTADDGAKMMHGVVFLRPHETFHVATRKFLEREVFRSSVSQTIPMDKLLGKCYVMHVRDYIKQKPEHFAEKDVFVCESRYNMRGRCFKKIKTWPFVRESGPASVRFVLREECLELKRVMSVFKERIEKHKGELEELKLQEALVEREKPNVPLEERPAGAEPQSVYYQQFNTICSGTVKTGDFVYVATQAGKQSIAQIQQIWENGGKSYFRGPWLLAPSEIQPPLIKSSYRQELLLSTVDEMSPVIGIVGRCAVLEYGDYVACRPTEIPESDVYICESTYDEVRKSLRKLHVPMAAPASVAAAAAAANGLRKFQHGPEVTQDEVFYFKTPIKPFKDTKTTAGAGAAGSAATATTAGGAAGGGAAASAGIVSELNDSLGLLEDSLDGNPPSVNSDIALTSSPAPSVSSTPLSSKVKSKTAKKSLTGYILYSSDVRKGICQSNPESTFGDISRMVGTEWKNLPSSVKQVWEDRALKLNEESAAAAAAALKRELEENPSLCSSPGPGGEPHQPGMTFECRWDKCDYQFEDAVECMEHCILDGSGHIQRTTVLGGADTEFVCLWRNCIRMKKNMQAFPSLVRLVKHVREVHLSKGGRIVAPSERSKNFVPRKMKATQAQILAGNGASVQQQGIANVLSPRPGGPPLANGQDGGVGGVAALAHAQLPLQPIVVGPPPEPMFVTVPPRPQRVLHSDAYIRYIESLQTGANGGGGGAAGSGVAAWKRALKPITPLTLAGKAPHQLPTNWLGAHATGNANDVLQALCHLRNFMVDDALEIQRHCY